MAHEIETTAFFGTTPWHGLGTRLDEADQYSTPRTGNQPGGCLGLMIVFPNFQRRRVRAAMTMRG